MKHHAGALAIGDLYEAAGAADAVEAMGFAWAIRDLFVELEG